MTGVQTCALPIFQDLARMNWSSCRSGMEIISGRHLPLTTKLMNVEYSREVEVNLLSLSSSSVLPDHLLPNRFRNRKLMYSTSYQNRCLSCILPFSLLFSHSISLFLFLSLRLSIKLIICLTLVPTVTSIS